MHIMQLVSGKVTMNGAMVHCVQLCQRLVQQGHRVTLVCRPNSGVLEYVADQPIEVVTSMQHRWPTDELRRIAAIVREREVDVMHTHMSRSQFFGVLLRHMTGVPCVATAHCQSFKGHRAFNDFVIANSEANRRTQMLKNLVRPSRIETVYCPIDLGSHEPLSSEARREVRQTLGAADDTPLVGLVGNVCPRKGHDILIRALPALLKKHPTLLVAIIGNLYREHTPGYQELAQRLGVNEAIRWVGFRHDMPQVMASLDVLAVPSRAEPFGLTAVEALAVGTPVVASRVGGLPETVDHEQTGLLIPPRRPQALAEALDRLLADADFHQRCSSAARHVISQRYDAERLWTRIEEILIETATRRTRRKAA